MIKLLISWHRIPEIQCVIEGHYTSLHSAFCWADTPWDYNYWCNRATGAVKLSPEDMLFLRILSLLNGEEDCTLHISRKASLLIGLTDARIAEYDTPKTNQGLP